MATSRTGITISAMLLLAANAQASPAGAPQQSQREIAIRQGGELKWGHCDPFFETGVAPEMLSALGCN